MCAAVTALPESQARAGSTACAIRLCQVVNSVSPRAAAMECNACTSAKVAPGGFSSITCRPACKAAAA